MLLHYGTNDQHVSPKKQLLIVVRFQTK